MQKFIKELNEIPEAVNRCYIQNKKVRLPEGVPYLAMGGSSYAAETLKYCGADIKQEVASEFAQYLAPKKRQEKAVLISQSGKTSEVLWCAKNFRDITVVTNHADSVLATLKNVSKVVSLEAGEEVFLSATKTFINTLITLYVGLGFDPRKAIKELDKNFETLREEGKDAARMIYQHCVGKTISGRFVVGSGPALGAANDGALVLMEVLKELWQGISVGQYDHGPKETADSSVVVFLDAGGPDSDRIANLVKLLRQRGALVVVFKERKVPIEYSPLLFLPRLYFMTNYLGDLMGLNGDHVGGKVTIADTKFVPGIAVKRS